MLLLVYRPSSELFPQISSLLSDFMNNAYPMTTEREGIMMPMDLYETDKEFLLLANFPGLRKEDVKISVDKNTLSIAGKNREKEQKVEGTIYRDERYKGDYHRTISFHIPVNFDEIQAKLEDGILRISIPKEEVKPKKEISIS
ncbi:MAG: Hsp20/alpha crystallin family protein [Candidatus Cloacimonetes bacterium]|nr:Hsp20/alpha crystallin family protein [Candidatus Cloacimonadota bacterium]